MTKHCYNEMHGHLIEKDSENSEKNKGKISPFVTGRKTDSWCGEMIVISSILQELHGHDSQLQPSSSSVLKKVSRVSSDFVMYSFRHFGSMANLGGEAHWKGVVKLESQNADVRSLS